MEQATVEGDAAVVATIGGEGFVTEVRPAPPHDEHLLVVDQAADTKGGTGRGPNPFTYLYTALAGCVAQTIHSYVTRKGYPLEQARVLVYPEREGHEPVRRIALRVELEGAALTAEHRERILSVASRCPVHRTLEAGVTIV